MANGCNVTTAKRKMMVKPASKIFCAISFGVFWRSAPSTKAIIRSRNVSPGLEVIFTLIRSDKTRVPPVTAERSPPASRITGADSPVIADSSTDATPSTISPSDGMNSPAITNTRSPAFSFELGTCSVRPSLSTIRLAIVSERALRSVSACALPRPSAMASAKFANMTVNHNHSVICRLNLKAPPLLKSNAVVMTLPISTTNMTGLPIICRGFSLRNASQMARRTIFHSQTAFFLGLFGECPNRTVGTDGIVGVCVVIAIGNPLERLARDHEQMLKDRAQTQCRKECQGSHDQKHSDQERGKYRRGHRECPQRRRYIFLAREIAGD